MFVVDERCLRKERLRHIHRLYCFFDFAFQIVALIDHVGDIGALSVFPLEIEDLVKNSEDLIRVNGAQGQIVIGVAPSEFQGTLVPLKFELWIPATMMPALLGGTRDLEDSGSRAFSMVGMLRPARPAKKPKRMPVRGPNEHLSSPW